MGTILTGTPRFSPSAAVHPNPAERVRAGGAAGIAVTILGADANGGVTYTALTSNVRIRHLGGIGQVLAVTVNGLDVTVQLGTDGAGAVTSSAAAVKAAFDAVPAAVALATSAVTGTGASMAGLSPDGGSWVSLSAGAIGSIRPIMQELIDRSEYAYRALYGLRRKIQVWSTDGATLQVKGSNSIIVTLSSLWRSARTTGSLGFTASDKKEGGAGALLANTWYFCYLFTDANSAVDIEISTTAPGTDYWEHKDSDTTRYYLFCFKTKAAGAIIPFFANDGAYGFVNVGNSDGETNVLDNGTTSAAWTEADVSAFVPTHVRVASLWARLDSSDGGVPEFAWVRPAGVAAATGMKIITGVSPNGVLLASTSMIMPVACTGNTGAARKVEWKTNDSTKCHLYLAVAGFSEP